MDQGQDAMSENFIQGRTSAEIREDIGRTRAGLDFLADALEGRLSTGSLIDQALGMLRGRGGSDAPLGDLIRAHPGPTALFAAAVVWLAIENRKEAAAAEESAPKKRSTQKTGATAKKRSSGSARKRSSARKTATGSETS
jgi:hypothetical protein